MARKQTRPKGAHTRIIDAHAHVKWYGYDAAALVENMDERGIERMWLLTWEAPAEEVGCEDVLWPGCHNMPLEHVVEACRAYPDRFVPFYAPDPRVPGWKGRLEGAITYYGVRGCGELKVRMMMDDPRMLDLFQFCGEKGLPLIFHLDIPLPPGTFSEHFYCAGYDNLARALQLCPKTTFIGHAPGFWREISGDATTRQEMYVDGRVTPGGRLWEFMDTYPNLWCDLSANSALGALSRDPAKGKEFLLRYQDRCMFGRDYFDDRLHDFIKSCRLPAGAMRKIMSGNALRLVPI